MKSTLFVSLICLLQSSIGFSDELFVVFVKINYQAWLSGPSETIIMEKIKSDAVIRCDGVVHRVSDFTITEIPPERNTYLYRILASAHFDCRGQLK